VKGVRVTLLVDDDAPAPLRAEHGLSLWVEAGGRRILFDTGQGRALERNARLLGVPLGATDDVVLSHGHYDHAGGLAALPGIAPGARVVLRPGAAAERFSVPAAKPPRAIGMPRAARDALRRLPAGAVVEVRGPLRLADGIFVTGPIPRLSGFEDAGGPFFLDPEGRRKDKVEDDQAMWIDTPAGLIVCVGCCHAGVINTLTHVRKAGGGRKIRAVIGGFHLRGADSRRLGRTVDALRALAPALLVPCHCTGEEAVRAMRDARIADITPGAAGTRFVFPAETPGGETAPRAARPTRRRD
jgi:7,8-dihydropterin-6-yl-methyl-4-(beta-D-ribofuranosyl)aminobenzene 5'-phosphate synthase